MLLTVIQQITHVSPDPGQGGMQKHAPTTGHRIVSYFFKLGLLGLFFIAAIDSSPIPLPIPGSSDLLVVLLAAERHGWFAVTLIATIGSVVGAAASYQTGVAGGLPLVNKYVPARFRDRIMHWAEHHSLLSVALPAVLPPPAPLMPFLIAAGALRMPKRRFYLSFTISRFTRHALFAWLGLHYGRTIMPLYLRFADKYGWVLLVMVWGSVAFGAVYAIIKLRARKPQRTVSEAAAA
jgi:membrane protein YqaA with SNARE-associated domain